MLRLGIMLLHIILITLHIKIAYSQDLVTMEGDVMIAGMFSIQEEQDSVCADSLSTVSIQMYQAVRWTLQQLNRRNFIPNVTIGLNAYKTCGQSAIAVKHAVDMVKTSSGNSTKNRIYGIIGPERSSETQQVSRFLSSLPADDSLLQISISATAAVLADRTTYRNLYRVIESDTIQVDVILKLILELKWNYVAIGYENDIYGIHGATALKNAVEMHDICVPIFEMIQNLTSIVLLRENLDIQSSPVSGMIYFGRGQMVKRILEYLDRHLNVPNFQLIVSEALALESTYLKDDNDVVYDRAKGLLVPTPVYDPVQDYTTYWNSLFENHTLFRKEAIVNPWITLYFESMTGCKLTPDTDIGDCWDRSPRTFTLTQQPLFVSYAILGAGVLAQVLKNVHSDLCAGQEGICDSFNSLRKGRFTQEMERFELSPIDLIDSLFPATTNISFSEGKLEVQRGKEKYQIYNFQRDINNEFSFKKVGTYNGSLQLTHDEIHSYEKSGLEISPVVSQCQAGFLCSECLTDPVKQLIHIPGDFYVIGLVPVHNKHTVSNNLMASNYFHYGSLRTSVSIDIAEAMIHAVHTINSNTGQFEHILGGKKLGLVVLDTSNNQLIIKDRVVSLHKGELDLGGGVMSSQIFNRIIGYAGPLGSSVSIPLSSTMQELNQLFIAYASTSVKLSDREEHPTFMRTTSSLDKQVVPMMKVVKAIGANYIQILYTDESYGQSGMEAIKTGARKEGVCVARALPVKEGVAPETYIGIVNELRRFRYAKLVIVFARSHTAPALMKTINDEIKLGEFIFFGSGEGWAKRQSIITGNYNLKGSLTMAQELPIDPKFEKYFRNITTSTVSPHNPWFREYLEEKANCYFPDSFVKRSTSSSGSKRPCTDDLLSSLSHIDTWVPFAANAVYALVLGFNKTLSDICSGFMEKCARYSTSQLIRHAKDVMLEVYEDGTPRRVFDSDGNGASGFRIAQVFQPKGSTDLDYKNVGTASDEVFEFDVTLLDGDLTYTSTCPTEYECEKCQTTQTSSLNVPMVTAIAVEAVVILILIVVIVVICVKCRKSKDKSDHYNSINERELQSSNGRRPEHSYITPVHDTTDHDRTDEDPQQSIHVQFENASDSAQSAIYFKKE